MIAFVQLVLYFLAAFGFCFVVGMSGISLPLREELAKMTGLAPWFLKLIECPACVSFHLGLWAGVFGFGSGWISSMWLRAPVLACATSASSLILSNVVSQEWTAHE